MSTINRYTIEDVTYLLGLHADRIIGNQHQMKICPFCGGDGYKFAWNPEKGRYSCFRASCDAAGNARDLYRELSGKTFINDKAVDCEILSRLNGNTEEYSNFKINLDNQKKNQPKQCHKREDEYCSEVFKEILSILTLRKNHLQNLLDRGFSERFIEKMGFKSNPTDRVGLCRKLMTKGYELEGVPGFFINKDGDWEYNCPERSMLCPAIDAKRGLILGFQARLDNPGDKYPKYLWISSVGKERGTSSGAPATYLKGKSCVTIITEGILKATVIYHLLKGKYTVIGVAGIKHIKSLEPYIDRGDYYVEAFDMDKFCTEDADEKEIIKAKGIMADTNKLYQYLSSHNKRYTSIKWELTENNHWRGNYKGLDDKLNSNKKAIKDFEEYIKRASFEK